MHYTKVLVAIYPRSLVLIGAVVVISSYARMIRAIGRDLALLLWIDVPSFVTGDANPSPNSYSLPILLGPRIPNRASSACYSLGARQQLGSFDTDYAKTPGPARYRVTTPEIYQRKAPAYSMLSRSFMPGGTVSALIISCFVYTA